MADRQALEMWTIYNSPRDMPGRYVARKWLVDGVGPGPRATDEILSGSTLDIVRDMLPPGMVCLSRVEADDPAIVETWI